jgi:hypothetical protein
VCLARADAWLAYAVTERGGLFLQFSSKLLVEVFVLFPIQHLLLNCRRAVVDQAHGDVKEEVKGTRSQQET